MVVNCNKILIQPKSEIKILLKRGLEQKNKFFCLKNAVIGSRDGYIDVTKAIINGFWGQSTHSPEAMEVYGQSL